MSRKKKAPAPVAPPVDLDPVEITLTPSPVAHCSPEDVRAEYIVVHSGNGWLIERGGNPPRYWDGDGWTQDNLEAVRFARQADGERVRLARAVRGESGMRTAAVLEHTWCDEVTS